MCNRVNVKTTATGAAGMIAATVVIVAPGRRDPTFPPKRWKNQDDILCVWDGMGHTGYRCTVFLPLC